MAAANFWTDTTSALFASASYHSHKDPLDRVLAYVDFRAELLEGAVEEFTCLVGTMVQENYLSSDAIRAACDASISGHAASLEADISAAAEKYDITDQVDAVSLALHTQAVLQGAFVLAKARGSADIARDSVAHLKRYIMLLFNRGDKR